MKSSNAAREEIFKIINNQIEENDPPIVRITYRRLQNYNFDKDKIMQMIGQCLVMELYDVMKHKKKFNEKRYIENLKALPEKPLSSKT
ncbi:MAG: hypothetical protein IPI77_24255 [Saprospiraceae bacterium]|nr:hypothetical protein [Saprospiraceae bacterium]